MESEESVITEFKLHFQIHSSKSTNRQSALIFLYQRDIFPCIHIYNFGEVHAQIQLLFSVDFGAQVFFSTVYTVLKILLISYPYRCLFAPLAQKGMGREKITFYHIQY